MTLSPVRASRSPPLQPAAPAAVPLVSLILLTIRLNAGLDEACWSETNSSKTRFSTSEYVALRVFFGILFVRVDQRGRTDPRRGFMFQGG